MWRVEKINRNGEKINGRLNVKFVWKGGKSNE